MRTMMEIINLIIDGEIATKEQASVLVHQEVTEMMEHFGMSKREATANLLTRIHATATRYLTAEQAKAAIQLFNNPHKKETQH